MESDAQHRAVVATRCCLAAVITLAASRLIAGEVVVAFPLSLQPYFLPFQESGLAYDTIRAAFSVRGYAVRPLYVSPRKIGDLVTDDSRADCIPMVSRGTEHGWRSAERIRLLHAFAITRPGVQITRLEDLKDKRVLGYPDALGNLGGEFRSVMRDNPRYREIYNHRAQVRLLLQGSVEVIIADRLLTSWYLDYLREEGTTETEVAYHDMFEPVAHEFICQSSEVAEQFSAGLAQILADGTLKDILSQYGGAAADAMLLPLEGQSADSNRTGTPPEAADTDD